MTSGRRHKLTESQELEIAAWWRQHMTMAAKARQYGISTNTLRATLAKYGSGHMRPATYKELLVKRHQRDSGSSAGNDRHAAYVPVAPDDDYPLQLAADQIYDSDEILDIESPIGDQLA